MEVKEETKRRLIEKLNKFERLNMVESGAVVFLLQQDEKYRKMWELLESSMEGQYCITPMEVYFKKDTVNQQMGKIKERILLEE